MRVLVAAVLLLLPLTSNAGLIATANGVVAAGCNNCESASGYDPFGLGMNADLSGYEFNIEFRISDDLLSVTPSFGSGEHAIRWTAGGGVDDYMQASVTLNGHTYPLPSESLYYTWFAYYVDGREDLYLANEDTETREGGSAFVVDTLRAIDNGLVEFRSSNRGPQVPWLLSSFVGTIGAIDLRPEGAVPVPEPPTVVLLTTSLMMFFGFGRRRRSNSQNVSY